MKQFHLKIFGRVQGVFFRAEACEKARQLGLAGWVRNTRDGAVESVAQGNEKALDEFVEWCRIGPNSAYVENIDVVAEQITEKFTDFKIRSSLTR